MKKKAAIGVGVLLAFVAVGALLFWHFIGKPLYEPGMVRAGKNLRGPLTPPPQAGDQNFWNVEEDIRLYHFFDGEGKNVLVVHGGPGFPIRAPLPGLRPLMANYRFVYYDQRGCGRSTRPVETFSSPNFYENLKTLDRTLGLGAQIADIERVRRIIGEEKLTVIGHSLGAFLASLYAAEFPERVRGLVLVAPASLLLMPPEGGGLFEEVRRLLPASMKDEYAAFLREYLDYSSIFSKSEAELVSLNERFAEYYGAAARSRNMSLPKQSDASEAGGWMVHAMYLSMGRRHDYRKALNGVQAPVLVLHGDYDLQPEKTSRSYAGYFPNSQFKVVKNAGHFMFDDQPQEIAAVIGNFLNGLDWASR